MKNNRRLLICDSDPKNIRILDNYFSGQQDVVESAASDQEAIEKLRKSSYDLVLSELAAPGIDGYHILEAIQRNPLISHTPVIFLTPRGDLWNRVKSLKLGAKDIIVKPMHVKEIVARVNLVLDRLERRRRDEVLSPQKFNGRLEDYCLTDMIEAFGAEHNNGALTLYNENGLTGVIHFRKGMVINANTGSLVAEDAIYKMMSWQRGRFSMLYCDVDVPDRMSLSNLGILLQGVRRMEQRDELMKQLPSFDAIVVTASNFRKILEQKDLTQELRDFLNLFDGERTLGRVVAESREDEMVTLKRMVKLYRLGFLHTLRDFTEEKEELEEPVTSTELEQEEKSPAAEDSGQLSDLELEEKTQDLEDQSLLEADPFYDFKAEEQSVSGAEQEPAVPHQEEIAIEQPGEEEEREIRSVDEEIETAIPAREQRTVNWKREQHPEEEEITIEWEDDVTSSPLKDHEKAPIRWQREKTPPPEPSAEAVPETRTLMNRAKGAVLVIGTDEKSRVEIIRTLSVMPSELKLGKAVPAGIHFGTAQFRGGHYLNIFGTSMGPELTPLIEYLRRQILGSLFLIHADAVNWSYHRYLLKMLKQKINGPLMVVATGSDRIDVAEWRSKLAMAAEDEIRFCQVFDPNTSKQLIFSLFRPLYKKRTSSNPRHSVEETASS